MADISKCVGNNCPMKESCYRFTATPNEWRQSYFMVVPVKFVGSVAQCEEYWPIKELSK